MNPNNYPFWVIVSSMLIVIMFFIARSISTYFKFAYPNAKFQAIGNPFIDEKELNRLLDSKEISSFKDALNTIKDYDIKGEDVGDIQRSLDNNLLQVIQMMKKDSSKKMKNFYNKYLEKMDIYLIKNEVKRKLSDGKTTGKPDSDRAILQKTKELLIKLEYAEKKDIPTILKNYGFEKEITSLVSEEKIDYLKLDNELDKHVINNFKKVKVPHKCEAAKQLFVKTMIDIINIKNVLRARHLDYDKTSCKQLFIGEGKEIAPWKYDQLLEFENVSQIISSIEGTSYYNALKESMEQYNKKKSIQTLENALDSAFLKIIKQIAMQNYITIGPTLRFLVSKEFEIRNLKIIAKGVDENLPSDFIRSLLITEAV